MSKNPTGRPPQGGPPSGKVIKALGCSYWAGWLRDGQGRVAPSLARQIERHHVAPTVDPPRADQAGGMVKELHPRRVEIHDRVPARLTVGRVQIHATALAERIHTTPTNPSPAGAGLCPPARR